MSTPVLSAFHKWEVVYGEASECLDDTRSDALFAQYTGICTQMIDLPTTSAADFAAKLIAFTQRGDFMLDCDEGKKLLAEATGLIASASLQSAGDKAEAVQKLPVERVNRLAHELAQALDEWMEGEFMGVILPNSRGRGFPVMFGSIAVQQRMIEQAAKKAA